MDKLQTQLSEINGMQIAQQTDIITPQQLLPEVVGLLTDRIGDEYKAHYFYKNAANWCREKAYFKAATFFEAEAANEGMTVENEKMKSEIIEMSKAPVAEPVQIAEQKESATRKFLKTIK